MAFVFGSTLKCIAKGSAAVFNGSIEQHEYRSYRECLTRACLYLFTFVYALVTILKVAHPAYQIPIKYTWAELLINYQGGFVRRGLLGEILFRLQPVIPSVVAASILIFCCYCLFTYLVLMFLSDAPLVVFLFFVFSPASFLFPVYDSWVFGRKEFFFFLAFALAIFIYRRSSDYRIKVCSLLSLYTISAFVHEAALFFAPLAACLLVFSMDEGEKRFRWKVLCALFFYFFALGIFLSFSIDRHFDTAGIVRSWSPYFPNIETAAAPGAAMDWLNKGFELTGGTRELAGHFNQFTGPYLVNFCLALLPIILLLMHTTHLDFFKILRRKEPFLFVCATASLLAPFLLFLAWDWGRWIYFISMHTFVFLIALINFGLVEYKAIPTVTRYQWKMYTLFFLYYTLLWKMPHIRSVLN